MCALKDMSGMVFGNLTVISRADSSESGKARWNCKCSCGNEITADGCSLRRGMKLSCGCIRRDILIKRNTTHGKSKTRIYGVYRHMKERCYSRNDKRYSEYGGRGIGICASWLGENGFQNFYDWATSHGYSDDLTIDRIDVNGDYEPGNCRWATAKVQQNNRRNNRYITCRGKTKTASEWSDISGIKSLTIIARLNRGMSDEDAVFTPLMNRDGTIKEVMQ